VFFFFFSFTKQYIGEIKNEMLSVSLQP